MVLECLLYCCKGEVRKIGGEIPFIVLKCGNMFQLIVDDRLSRNKEFALIYEKETSIKSNVQE